MRNRSTFFLILILFLTAMLLGYMHIAKPFYQGFTNTYKNPDLYQDIINKQQQAQEAEENKTWEELSSQQKISQLIALPVLIPEEGAIDSKIIKWVEENKPGFITYYGDNLSLDQIRQTNESLGVLYDHYLYLPLMVAFYNTGDEQSLSGLGFTQIPQWSQLCVMDDSQLNTYFSQSAQEINQAGINIVIGPSLDTASSSGQVLYNQTCKTDQQTIDTASNFIENFAKVSVMSVIKHFPGIGQVEQDLANNYVQIDINDTQVDNFSKILKNYPNIGVLTSNVAFNDFAQGEVCSQSQQCLERFEDYFQDAYLFSDQLDHVSALNNIKDDSEQKNLVVSTQKAIEAGNHVLMFSEQVTPEELSRIISNLALKYDTDDSFKTVIDQRIRHLIKLKKVNHDR